MSDKRRNDHELGEEEEEHIGDETELDDFDNE